MKKLMWFLHPRSEGEDPLTAWQKLASEPPATGVIRWLRSVGASRSTSLLAGGAPPPGATTLLEEVWVKDGAEEDVRAWLLDKQRGLSAKLEPLVDLSQSHLALTEEIRVIDGPRQLKTGRTTMALFVRRPDQTREDSLLRWTTGHADMVRRHGIMTHYTQCPIIDPECPFDGIPIIYFATEDVEADFLSNSTVLTEQMADSRAFIDHERTLRFSFGDDQHEAVGR